MAGGGCVRRMGFRQDITQTPKEIAMRRSTIQFDSLESRRLMSASLSLNGAQTIVPGATIDVSNDASFGQSGMRMAVNPANPLMLAGISQRIGGMNEIDIYWSANGGSTWAKTAIDNGTAGLNDGTGAGTRFDPTITFDEGGRLFIAYGNDVGTSTKAVIARSPDGGATFDQFRVLASNTDIYNGTAAEIHGDAKFSLASGPDGHGGQATYLAYIQSAIEGSAGLDQRVMLDATNDAGATFLPSLTVNNTSIAGADSGNYGVGVAVGPAGQAYVVWHN